MTAVAFNKIQSIQAADDALWIYPTDTLYALGGLATPTVSARINQIKERPENKSLSIIVPNIDWVVEHLAPLKRLRALIESKRGAYTILVKKKHISDFHWLSSNAYVGIRLLNETHPAQQWVQRLGEPMIATSANFSGEDSAGCFEQLNKQLLQQVDYWIKDDTLLSGTPSALWDLERNNIIKRT